jgi:type IV fimbrial biogenesis protein FimT
MRRLSPPRHSERGLNLVEVMVAISIAGLLLIQGLPALGEYLTNARLRSAGHLVLEQTLFAQNEAIRRNGEVRVKLSGSQVQVLDATRSPAVEIRSVSLPGSVEVTTDKTIAFGSMGRPASFGTTYDVALTASGVTCSDDTPCPGLHVAAGGGVKLCGDSRSCP